MKTHANGALCPYCKSHLGALADLVACSLCQTFYHRECWDANGRCSVFGCISSNMIASQTHISKSNQHYPRSPETQPRKFKWILRWILVLPASFGAALLSNLIVVLGEAFGRISGNDSPLFWIQLVNSALCGYYFVYGGTKTAPEYRPVVAIVLTVVYGIWEAFVVSASLRIGDTDPSYPLWWFIVTTIVGIVAAIVACAQLQEQ